MVTRHERLLNEQRALHQGICKLMLKSNSYVDMLALLPTLAGMREDALQTGYYIKTNAHHEPLFDGSLTRDLVAALVDAQLSVLRGPIGHRTAEAVIASICTTMGKHHLAPRERSRASARRDVARSEICLASAEALSLVLNKVVAQRISKRRRQARQQGRRK